MADSLFMWRDNVLSQLVVLLENAMDSSHGQTQDYEIRTSLRQLAQLTFHLRQAGDGSDTDEYLRALARWGCDTHTMLSAGASAVVAQQVERHVPPGAVVSVGAERFRVPEGEEGLAGEPDTEPAHPEGRDSHVRELLRVLPGALGWNWGGPDWELVQRIVQSEVSTRDRFITDPGLRDLFLELAEAVSEVRDVLQLKPILDAFEEDMLAA